MRVAQHDYPEVLPWERPSHNVATPVPPAAAPLKRRIVYETAKRVFDVAFASALLVATSPMSLAVAALIRVTSRGPIIFSQTRLGRYGLPFSCYKFRTMVENAEEMLRDPELARRFEVAWKLEDDARVTPIGRWLRKTSLDELPQLVNVLRGEMSVVGPRPVQPRELHQQFGPWAATVTSVKPGLTSLWVVSGRSLLNYEDRVQLEVQYVRRRGLWLDTELVLRTISAVLYQRGAI